MIQIVALACSILHGAKCKDVQLNFEMAALTPTACMMNGQFALAAWVEENPNWTIAKWSCGVAGQSARL